MTKNEKPNADADKPDPKKPEGAEQDGQTPSAPAKSKGWFKYIIFGVAGLGLMGAAIFVTLMFLGGEKSKTADSESTDKTALHDDKQRVKKAQTPEDSLLQELAALDSSTITESLDSLGEVVDPIEQLVQNIDVMNAEADSANAFQATVAAKEDSIKAQSWIEKQKDDLTKREVALTSRQKEVEELDRKVSQKVMRLEQSLADRVANLAKLYDGMEPSAVAKLAENLDDSIVVAIIPRMKQKNASQLLSLLPPQRAAKLSKQIITLAGE